MPGPGSDPQPARKGERELEGVEIVGNGPTVDGYLAVGVMSDVATAKAKFDEIFGAGAVRAHEDEPGIAL